MSAQRFVTRRTVLAMALLPVLALMSCASRPTRPEPIVVDTTGVKDVKDLIRAIKRSGEGLLPQSASDESFLVAISKSFVDNARAAANEYGIHIPSWILDRLPSKRVAWDKPDKTDAVVFITILGVAFILPKLFFFTVVLASILLMTNFIAEELRKLKTEAI